MNKTKKRIVIDTNVLLVSISSYSKYHWIYKLNNVNQVQVYFNFNLIKNDPDDNKFADCAISSNTDYLLTNDKDFNILKSIPFPKVNVVNIDEFRAIMIK